MDTLRKVRVWISLPGFSIGVVSAVLWIAATTASGGTSETHADTSLDAEELAFMTLLNDYRAQHGLTPLLIDTSIQNAAEWMSTDMGQKNYFSHTDSLGRTPWDRMCHFGYCHNTWKGENIAAGYSTGAAVFQGWKDSPGHDANMLGEHYRVMGLSRVHTPGSDFGVYWTNDFGGHVAGPPPPPAPTSTPSPTPSPTPRPTASPTPVPTPTPTPQPTPRPHDGPGDVDCDQRVGISDMLRVLRYVAGITGPANGCPPVGALVTGSSGRIYKGDVDCSGVVNTEDALLILRFSTGDSSAIPAGC